MADDINCLVEPVFKIEENDEEFDMDIPPTSGNEYLRRVQLEAQLCPGVVVASVDVQTRPDKITLPSELMTAPHGYAPSIPWQRQQAAAFSRVRQKFAQYSAKLKKKYGFQKQVDVPCKDDIEGWCRLCFGHVQPKRAGASSAVDCHDGGSQPLLTTLVQMDQPTVLAVLEYHLNWLQATGFSPQQGCWFYALLVCLEKPLCPEACSLLRTLARLSAHLRASLESSEDPLLAPLNLLICLVSRYFDQMDLSDKG